MINLHLGLNEAKKLARDIDTIIELTEGRFISLSVLRNVLLQELETFVDLENKRYRLICLIGDTEMDNASESMSFSEVCSEYVHCRDLQPENRYEIEEVE